MKVQFEFTAADMAEVGSRAADRSAVVRKWRIRARAAWAVVFGMLVFILVPAGNEIRGAAALLAAIGTFLATRRSGARGNRRLLEYFRDRLGGDGPFTCEVELTDAGIVGRQLGTESRRAWAQVASVAEVQGGIEFVFRPLGSLLVRDRAFADARSRAEFLALARGYLQR
jgi:hypothetical protein